MHPVFGQYNPSGVFVVQFGKQRSGGSAPVIRLTGCQGFGGVSVDLNRTRSNTKPNQGYGFMAANPDTNPLTNQGCCQRQQPVQLSALWRAWPVWQLL